MVGGNPVVWVKKRPGAYKMISDQHGTRLEQSKSMVLRVVGTVFFLVLASIVALFSVGIYNEVQSADDSSTVSGCWDWQTEVTIGGNPPYCYPGPIGRGFDSLEVSEDQHIRERTEDRETGYTYTEEYRWEDVGDSIVYGFVEDASYAFTSASEEKDVDVASPIGFGQEDDAPTGSFWSFDGAEKP